MIAKKEIWLPIVLFCALPAILRGQTRTTISQYDSAALIRDRAGHVLPFQEWQKLLSRGDYGIFHGRDSAGLKVGMIKHLSRADRESLADLAKPKESTNFTTGETLSCNLPGLDGRRYTLPAKGKIVVLHFGCLTCYYSSQQLPAYNELVDSFADNPNILFLAISPDNPAAAKKALDSIPFRYHVIAGQSHLYQSWGIQDVPQDVIVDKEGKLFYQTVGAATTTMVWLGRKIGEAVGK